ncbi:MAG: SDR family NAD(P)-dependent oxidoreductase [Leptolyngbyaceae cyanobacterium bins.302]|nr:SDR family NAD(P)-dependent oxidoreductase [Leptolyngbyaceae cyanobacterium bins.302]
MTQLNNALVLLTGAAGGFGQELTRQLLQAGSRLILTDLDDTLLWEQSRAMQATIQTGEILACFAVDLAEPTGCDRLYQQVKALGYAIDILINNAGIGLFGRMDEIPAEKWERLMQVNLLAPMRLSSLFVADMIARRQGHIVNMSSLAGWVAQAGLAHYSASKFGLRGFSEGLCNEVKPYNVQVTVVYPFFSRTPILHSEKLGTLAEEHQGVPDNWVTDPAKVMAATLQAIQQNKLHVFPDAIGQIVQRLKRHTPKLLDWISNALARRQQGGSSLQ